MLFREVINLISINYGENDIGDYTETETLKQVFADKQSVRQSEYYQAQAAGLRPELMFLVRSIDYNQETKLEYNDKQYSIIRTYDKDGETTELICQGLITG
ncbi:MAG: phage head closure protein [Bacillota bacterium]